MHNIDKKLEMTASKKEETFDQIYEQAHKDKNAVSYGWAQFLENIIWYRLLIVLIQHTGLFASLIMYGFGLYSIPIKPLTIAWLFIVGMTTFVGTTAGAHRLWSHRSYKANLPLRILLMILYSVLGLYTIYDWVRDHRVHHKYSETDADPYNAKRGFFFSHMGWFWLKRHPDCLRRGREVDLTDTRKDGVVMFQKKYAVPLTLLFSFTLPSLVPILFWEETVLHAVLTQCFIRYVLALHSLWSINSFAHLWGNRPYNRFINPTENLFVSFVTGGEGSHNYHHTFPWDYKAAELPYINFNIATIFIDTFAKIGWAYDLRQPSPELIKKVIQRIGHESKIHEDRE